eukprot:m.296369 g.296369  ORF g.296369 m.296369 type:complete len:512 (+) comp55161_c0_seq1:179-1714(+)
MDSTADSASSAAVSPRAADSASRLTSCHHDHDMCCRVCLETGTWPELEIPKLLPPPPTEVRRCWVCGAGANGVRGSVVSPQARGKIGKYHCVRCRHFLEGLVWWYMSHCGGKHPKDTREDFIAAVQRKVGVCVQLGSREAFGNKCPRLTHTVAHCLPDGDGISSTCDKEFHLLRNSSLCQLHRFRRCMEYFELANINQRSYHKNDPSDRKARRNRVLLRSASKQPSDDLGHGSHSSSRVTPSTSSRPTSMRIAHPAASPSTSSASLPLRSAQGPASQISATSSTRTLHSQEAALPHSYLEGAITALQSLRKDDSTPMVRQSTRSTRGHSATSLSGADVPLERSVTESSLSSSTRRSSAGHAFELTRVEGAGHSSASQPGGVDVSHALAEVRKLKEELGLSDSGSPAAVFSPTLAPPYALTTSALARPFPVMQQPAMPSLVPQLSAFPRYAMPTDRSFGPLTAFPTFGPPMGAAQPAWPTHPFAGRASAPAPQFLPFCPFPSDYALAKFPHA